MANSKKDSAHSINDDYAQQLESHQKDLQDIAQMLEKFDQMKKEVQKIIKNFEQTTGLTSDALNAYLLDQNKFTESEIQSFEQAKHTEFKSWSESTKKSSKPTSTKKKFPTQFKNKWIPMP